MKDALVLHEIAKLTDRPIMPTLVWQPASIGASIEMACSGSIIIW
jgi:hypothetical protein